MWHLLHLIARPIEALLGVFCALSAIMLYPGEEGKRESVNIAATQSAQSRMFRCFMSCIPTEMLSLVQVGARKATKQQGTGQCIPNWRRFLFTP
jgi:hypothetical protein